jgi:hypothetical protein
VMLTAVWGGTFFGEYQIWSIIFDKFTPEPFAIGASILLALAGVFTVYNCKVDFTDQEPPPAYEPNSNSCLVLEMRESNEYRSEHDDYQNGHKN